jgi:hypothetical protein
MSSWLDAPEHMTADRYASMSVPYRAIPMEYEITDDLEHELIFPKDLKGSPLGCYSIVINSDIAIFFAFEAGGTAVAQAPDTAYSSDARFYCGTSLPWTTRQRKDRIFVKNAIAGTTGKIYFILLD